MRVLDLFSGIGGFSLGLERAGMQTVAFCECEPYCRAVLRKHWPEIPIYDNVRTLFGTSLAANGIEAELICGGFPCQDISIAGNGAGINGERSGLWREFARIIGEVRPRYVVVENVSALLGRGLDTLLGDLAALGFDAEWHCIPASAIGAPHRRDRVWIIAYPIREQLREQSRRSGGTSGADAALAADHGPEWIAANSLQPRLQDWGSVEDQGRQLLGRNSRCWWPIESGICGRNDGIPRRVDRLRALGNAVVPQIPEIIGRAILMYEQR